MIPLTFVWNSVVKRFGRGQKQLGCPTANADKINNFIIPTGIYCGLVQLVIKNAIEVQEEPSHEAAYQEILQKLPYISPVRCMVVLATILNLETESNCKTSRVFS